jgi:hypothetical protein
MNYLKEEAEAAHKDFNKLGTEFLKLQIGRQNDIVLLLKYKETSGSVQ